ncbi:MAG: AI-2E family transporter [Proteobacteria bacterium]|nr:AI-2E family transporter [Pseudomonadota bacterium]
MNRLQQGTNSAAINGLFILACFYTGYFARVMILPIVVAFLLYFILLPLVRWLQKIYIPAPISALLVIIIFLGAIGYGFYSLSGPAKEWLAQGPQKLGQVTGKVQHLIEPLEKPIKGIFNIKEQITRTNQQPNSQEVTVKNSDLFPFGIIFASTGEFFAELSVVFFVLYFLLASGDFFLKKTIEILPSLKEKKEAVSIAREISSEITSFLVTKTITGIGLAIILTIVLYFMHLPNPLFWGVLAGVLEFIPYIGATIGTILCAIAALLVFNNPIQIILPPLVYFILVNINGNVVVPLMLSKSLTLHPVIVFVGIVFGAWIWGIIGGLIAIPMLSIFKIFCNNIESLKTVGKFLGE